MLATGRQRKAFLGVRANGHVGTDVTGARFGLGGPDRCLRLSALLALSFIREHSEALGQRCTSQFSQQFVGGQDINITKVQGLNRAK